MAPPSRPTSRCWSSRPRRRPWRSWPKRPVACRSSRRPARACILAPSSVASPRRLAQRRRRCRRAPTPRDTGRRPSPAREPARREAPTPVAAEARVEVGDRPKEPAARPPAAMPDGDGAADGRAAGAEADVERVPMTALRRTIAARLVQAQRSAAILTTFNEVDLAELLALRRRHRERFKARHGVDLGFMSLFARAVVHALREVPVVNASIDGDDIVYHRRVHLGIAVSTPRGLVVPVVRQADRRSLAEIE